MGVGDIVDESKAYFSRLLLPPQLSLLLRKQCLSLREQMLVAIRASCSSLPREREPFGGSRSNHCRNFRRCLSFTYTSSAQVYVNGLLNRRGRAVCNATPTPTLPRCASLRGRGYLVVIYISSAQVYVNGDGHSVRRRAPCNLVGRAFMPDVFCCRP